MKHHKNKSDGKVQITQNTFHAHAQTGTHPSVGLNASIDVPYEAERCIK